MIYKRRGQILDGADLSDEAVQHLEEAIAGAVGTYCVSDYREEWDLDALATEVAGLWPGGVDAERLAEGQTVGELAETLAGVGRRHYEQRTAEVGAEVMRQVERHVMLWVIDQKWRQHLREMDHLREGIHLRAMGQKDPATEWQREGFEMFGSMMTSIAMDFVRHVMHVQVGEPDRARAEPRLVGVSAAKVEAGPRAAALSAAGASAPAAASTATTTAVTAGGGPQKAPSQTPVVRSELEKVGRNAPCPCGSGRKFKQCHGRPNSGSAA